MILHPLSTQIVGSYAKPQWLARHQKMRALDGSWWRPEPEVLQEAKRDAVRLAIYEQERAGIDIVTDGEAQRAAWDRDFFGALSGVDIEHTEVAVVAAEEHHHHHRDETGWEEYSEIGRVKPIVTGPLQFQRSVATNEVLFAKSVARQPLKVAMAGPLSLSQQLVDRHYGDEEALILALAAALNMEMRALQAAGADILQIDEGSWHFDVDLARRVGQRAIARMVEGITVPTIVHVCYGYSIVYKEKSPSALYPEVLQLLSDCPVTGISLEYEQPSHTPDILSHCGNKHVLIGLLNLGDHEVESADHVASRLRAAFDVVPAERLHPCSDCGMWFLPRDVAYGKIKALVEGTRKARNHVEKTFTNVGALA
ncbi:putative Methionine synthase, vitamin-B12 independent [Mesorhizobium delmotii]|uniref:Putative Methionine synthase, vitamin-B12 independent n=2 Tax=Mesorhizobium delmotii TaxID=1631247 RepID=A0A2P9AGB4_9HYPH|nr:putative Methionine synthase, vitamin-B12 independent [Mesorhizobium delmotii]